MVIDKFPEEANNYRSCHAQVSDEKTEDAEQSRSGTIDTLEFDEIARARWK